MDQIAKLTSTVSVAASFSAGLHQLYLGYIFEGADGFSPILLCGWLLGDICNVIGTFWTHQLIFQRVIAIASTINDVALSLQHFYYKRKHKNIHGYPPAPEERPGQFLAVQWNALLRPYILFTLVSAARASTVSHHNDDYDADIDVEFLIGQCMAWVAELSYGLALIPQALDNFQRKSTGSVSIFVFVADALSSLNYLATIMLTMASKSSHKKRVNFAMEELPYIFGTSACAILDLILLLQYYTYPNFVIEVVADEEYHQSTDLTPFFSNQSLYPTNSYTIAWNLPRIDTSGHENDIQEHIDA